MTNEQIIEKLNELCRWLSHQKGMMSQDYAKELAKIIFKLKQSKPLSDEEIFDLTAWKKNPYELYIEMEKKDMIAFARAVEKRHGIK